MTNEKELEAFFSGAIALTVFMCIFSPATGSIYLGISVAWLTVAVIAALKAITKDVQHQSFHEWLSRHPCDKEMLWHLQNMLGSCLGSNHPLYKDAVQAWREKPVPTLQ